MPTTEPLPDPTIPIPSRFPFSLNDQKDWAEIAGRRVARHFGFRHQERDDIISAAHTMLVDLYRRSVRGKWLELGGWVERRFNLLWDGVDFSWIECPQGICRFWEFQSHGKYIAKGFNLKRVTPGGDPEGAFRGWAYKFIRSKCKRLAKQLRNGGTYDTTRPENEPAAVMVLGELAEGLEGRDGDGVEYLDVSPPTRAPQPERTDDLQAIFYGRAFGRHPKRAG